MKKTIRCLLWCLPWLLQSADAHAWGLYTHVFFAQWLVWGVPLLDGELRRAVSRYPKLVMAGACLPDLALVGGSVGTTAFDNTHCWEKAAAMLAMARHDEDRALIVGFYSHLYADVVAHHHFVPAHERMWLDWPMVAHVVAEWAMDAHIARHTLARPGTLMRDAEVPIVSMLMHCYGLTQRQARNGVRALARADGVLRSLHLPQWLYCSVARVDRKLGQRFDYFVSETNARLHGINRVLAGELPWPDANGAPASVTQAQLGQFTQHQIRAGQPLPTDCHFSPIIS